MVPKKPLKSSKPAKVEEETKVRNCYCVKIPVALFEALEKRRKELRHNKTAAVVTMAEAYLKDADA